MHSSPGMVSRLALKTRCVLARVPRGGGRKCCLCGCHVGCFLPYGRGWKGAPPLMRALGVVGSDLDWYMCPACFSNDRERHLVYYFRRLGLFEQIGGKAIMHFAPEPKFRELLAQAGPSRHVLADLWPAAPGVEKIDMLNIGYPDGSFDFVIANHVLEHVSDDLRALSELRRISRPGGIAILQTPYSAVLEKTICDPGVDTAAARLQLYGQEDHVRLYGRDIFSRFAAAGFVDRVAWHDDVLEEVDPGRYGVNRHEPLFLFERI